MMKSIAYCLLAAFLSPVAFAELGRVSVKGNQFVVPEGKPILFRGVDASDPDKLQRNAQWTRRYFEMAKSWGANIVRIPVHPAAWRIQGKEAYMKLLDQGVGWAGEVGLYVIIDWHSMGNLCSGRFPNGDSELYPPNMYDTSKEETFDFWQTVARRYSTNTTVAFFEVFNEPTSGGRLGVCTWGQWTDLMVELVDMIRANGGQAVPLIAGFNYAYDLTPVAKAPLDLQGIGYVVHPYPMKRKQPWESRWSVDWGFVAEKYPMFATELGFAAPDEKGARPPFISDESYGDAITAFFWQRGISYSVWCFDPQWAPTLIKDWNFTPTREGVYFKKLWQQKP